MNKDTINCKRPGTTVKSEELTMELKNLRVSQFVKTIALMRGGKKKKKVKKVNQFKVALVKELRKLRRMN